MIINNPSSPMRQLARQLSPERSQNEATSMHVGLLFKMMMIFHALLLRSSCEAVENDDNDDNNVDDMTVMLTIMRIMETVIISRHNLLLLQHLCLCPTCSLALE